MTPGDDYVLHSFAMLFLNVVSKYRHSGCRPFLEKVEEYARMRLVSGNKHVSSISIHISFIESVTSYTGRVGGLDDCDWLLYCPPFKTSLIQWVPPRITSQRREVCRTNEIYRFASSNIAPCTLYPRMLLQLLSYMRSPSHQKSCHWDKGWGLVLTNGAALQCNSATLLGYDFGPKNSPNGVS